MRRAFPEREGLNDSLNKDIIAYEKRDNKVLTGFPGITICVPVFCAPAARSFGIVEDFSSPRRAKIFHNPKKKARKRAESGEATPFEKPCRTALAGLIFLTW